MKEVTFKVMCSLGDGDGGEVYVNKNVSDEEYILIKEYYEKYDSVEECNALAPLCEKIIEIAKEENEAELLMSGDDNDIELCSYWISRIEGLY